MPDWHEIAPGTLIRRYAELDLTVGLVLGNRYALVIDTRGDQAQGAELAAAVRDVTSLPYHIVITHGHFDHCFGTEPFAPVAVWAQQRCAGYLRATAERQRAAWLQHYRSIGAAETASALVATRVVLPDHPVEQAVDLDLGGRIARLRHPGLGHTDHDLIVFLPEVAVLFAGDLVEQGAPPDFDDARTTHWPSTMDALLGFRPSTIVPGHGDPVDSEFVRAQREEIQAVAELSERCHAGVLTEEAAIHASPYPADTTRAALRTSDPRR